jgi:HAMP domain-containing protein
VSDPPVPDAFAHRIAHGGVTVTPDDPAMPEELSALVARLGRLVQAHEKS